MLLHVWPGWGHVYVEKSARWVFLYGEKRSVSFVNEIHDVVYILTVLRFFIFIGCYYLFRTLSFSLYYTHYCKILAVILYYILYCKYTIQLSSCKLFTNKLSIIVVPDTRATLELPCRASLTKPGEWWYKIYLAQQHLCMTLFTRTVISLLAGPVFLHNINTLAGPAGLTWESNLSHMLAWQNAWRLPHIKKWRIQKKYITFEHFTLELLLVNTVKAGGAFKKWRIFEDQGR